MFGFGYLEILVVLVVVVLLFPPHELPKLARSVARAYGTVRRTADDFRRSLLMDDELRKPIDEIRGAYRDARWEMQQASRKMMTELKQVSEETRLAVDIHSTKNDNESDSSSSASVESLQGRVPAAMNGKSNNQELEAEKNDGKNPDESTKGSHRDQAEPRIVANGLQPRPESQSVNSSETYGKTSEPVQAEPSSQSSS